jgi:hypothetical protein
MTPKIVRNELQIRLKVNDLSCRKREINAFIMDVINDINNNNNNNETNSNADNETNTNTNQTDGYLKSGSTLPSNSKTNSDSNHESDSSSDESICDEELARKLQKEEEIDAKQRVTRSNRSTNKKKTKINKSKKRKTDKSDNSYNEKSQKKAKNGYLKPCLLSPILADFLGENEVNNNPISHILSHIKSMNESHYLLLFPFRISYLRIFRENTFLSRNQL